MATRTSMIIVPSTMATVLPLPCETSSTSGSNTSISGDSPGGMWKCRTRPCKFNSVSVQLSSSSLLAQFDHPSHFSFISIHFPLLHVNSSSVQLL